LRHAASVSRTVIPFPSVYSVFGIDNLPELSGQLPATLSLLTNLVELHIQATSLSGDVPSALSTLTRLTSLHLSYNSQLNGTVSSGIVFLTSLSHLSLAMNALTGTLPVDIGLLANLW
jgi:hypothetical protein